MFPEGNLRQSFEYGEISKAAFPRTKVVRMSVASNEEPVGIIQGIYSSYFGFGMDLKVMRGPVTLVGDKRSSEITGKLLEALENYCKRNRVIHGQIFVPEAWQVDEVFKKYGYTLAEKMSEYTINLGRDANLLWKRIDHNKRRNIKRAMDAGVKVIESHNHEDLPVFYSLFENAAERHSFQTNPLSYFEAIWKTWPPELSRVFLANWDGKSVSGVFVAAHGKTVYGLAAGSLIEASKVRPNDIMHWKVMEWAIKNGFSAYQIGLISEPLPVEGSKDWGIWRWKREWNGNLNRIQIFSKYYLTRYKFVLKAKEFAERGYTFFKQLR
jgi:hypothetical protein